jgi:hypothetical protein
VKTATRTEVNEALLNPPPKGREKLN